MNPIKLIPKADNEEIKRLEERLKGCEVLEADVRLKIIASKYPDKFRELLEKYNREFERQSS